MSRLAIAAVSVCLLGTMASAEVTFEWVTVGNPGNGADPLNSELSPGIGAVDYVYRITKYEVTNVQYAAFLHAVAATDTNDLYNVSMGSEPYGGITQSGVDGNFTYGVKANMGNKPVNYISFFDAMRFVNWLHNGQPTGSRGGSWQCYSVVDSLRHNQRDSICRALLLRSPGPRITSSALYRPGCFGRLFECP